jgi:hypothetical protein
LLALGNRFLTASKLARALAELFVALVEHLELPVEHGVALGDAALLALHFLASAPNLLLEVLAQADDLFLARDDGSLPEVVRLSLGVADDPLRGFLGDGLGVGLPLALGAPPSRSA